MVFPQHPQIYRRASKRETNCSAPSVQSVMVWMVTHQLTPDVGCIHAHRISVHLEVQQYSDRELFWIVKNGIRLSGMPAFGKVEFDEHIWNLAHYVRTLRRNAAPQNNGAAQ